MTQVPRRGGWGAGFLNRWRVSLRELWRGSPGLELLTTQVVAVIAEEAEQCERLLWLVRQQQRYMADKNIGQLKNNRQEQKRATRGLRVLERRRLSLIHLLAQVPPDTNGTRPDLSRLMVILSDDYGRRFDQLCRVIGSSVWRLHGIKQRTAQLLDLSQFHIGEASWHLGPIDPAGAYRVAPATVDDRAEGAETGFCH